MSPALIVLLLSLLLGLQAVTTDLYLPALPALTEGFGASMAQAQLTLSGLLLSFGISQLFWGPLSDRFGRRPVLLWGLSAYVLASIASTLAPSMNWLIIARIIQGAALGATVMCARAIVRDLYQPTEGARIMSKGQTGLGVIACLTVPTGSLLTEWMGWRFALLALGIVGAATLALVALRFTETVDRKNPHATDIGTLFNTWKTILRHPTFWAYSTLSIASYGGLFTFLASSAFVFLKVLGLSKPVYGLTMFSMSFIYILGTMICRRLLPRLGVRHTVALAGGCTLMGGLLMALFVLADWTHSWALMLPFYFFILAHGVHQPCSQSGAVGPFPFAAGAASALNGFLMMVAAFAVGAWLGQHMDGTAVPMMLGICFWSVMIALSSWTLVQKYGKSVDA
jgi:DHA1 family bicyclomycin/chloramphenicol resistance-like MFS transporter